MFWRFCLLSLYFLATYGVDSQCQWYGKRGLAPANTSCSSLFSSTKVSVELRNIPVSHPTAPSLELDYVEIHPTFHAAPVPRVMIPMGRSSKSYIAAVEMTTTNTTREEQLELAKEKIAIAAKYGSDIVIFPETFFIGPFVYPECDEKKLTSCIQYQQETLDFCSDQSEHYGIWIVCTMYYWDMDSETRFYQKHNAAFVFDRKGTNLGSYYKMFPVFEMAYGIGNEQLYPSRKGVQVWDTDFGMRMCILICNDIFFSDLTAQCASLGADLVVWPAAWKGGRVLPALAMVHNIWIVNAPGPANIGKANVVDNVGRVVPEEDFVYMDRHTKIVELETEQVVLHNNFDGRIQEMLSSHPQGKHHSG
eukprot:TRINITY_DN600_c0_g1_i6.p1 TRINITY_DN600_c0_g1~~TRINITY_DN600_c0_g1_i6.p1  ORF type:complete len:363 (+),score=46.91 TRINITY_DN600_c0_g1_i6:324-1412(+)